MSNARPATDVEPHLIDVTRMWACVLARLRSESSGARQINHGVDAVTCTTPTIDLHAPEDPQYPARLVTRSLNR